MDQVVKFILLLRYVKKQFSESYKTTIGADFLSKELATAGGKTLTLQVRPSPTQPFYYIKLNSNLALGHSWTRKIPSSSIPAFTKPNFI